MKIGIFDSGIGGLLLAEAIRRELPEYDYLYLGDTKNVPYGNRSQAEIYQFTEAAVRHLFAEDCQIIVIACNTASAEALRRLQQEYLPANYPERRILGVLVPTAEMVTGDVGVLATQSTVDSGAFVREISKVCSSARVTQVAAPELVPLIESGNFDAISEVLPSYLKPFILSKSCEVILGCTHYSAIKQLIREQLPGITVLSQDELVPAKLRTYFVRHPEQKNELSPGGTISYQLTAAKPGYLTTVKALTGKEIDFTIISL